jgi:two-component system sensor histidine kinase KdpD
MGRLTKVQVDLVIAVGLSAAAAAVTALLHSSFGLTRVAAIFLAPVVIAGCIRGKSAGLLAALLSVVFYRLFLQFRVHEPSTVMEDALHVGVFLLVAVLTGSLAGRVQEEARHARARTETVEQLLDVSRRVNLVDDEPTVWPLLCDALFKLVKAPAVVLVDAAGSLQAQHGQDPTEGMKKARAALAPRPSERADLDGWKVRRIEDGGGLLGAAAWFNQAGHQDHGPGEESADFVLQMGAAALARQRANQMKLKLQSIEATASLREALLASISHDFRSPLAAIMGSSSSLLEYGHQFSDEVRHDLLLNIQDEAERLNDYIANLLNMSRLQAGFLEAQEQSVSVKEAVQTAQSRLCKHRSATIDVTINGSCNVLADRLLLEQTIYNVLDNAMKYGNGQAGITVTCNLIGPDCFIAIADTGPGLSEADRSLAFGEFHLGRAGKARGTGLGLSIVKGFVEAMGGTVNAARRTDGCSGLVVTIRLPRAKAE